VADNYELEFIKAGWDEVVKHVIDTDGTRRMRVVADACNAALIATAPGEPSGYQLSSEGDNPRSKRDYSATVITTTAEAMRDNARHNRLVQNAHLAGGA
jgi:hypothetical protein